MPRRPNGQRDRQARQEARAEALDKPLPYTRPGEPIKPLDGRSKGGRLQWLSKGKPPQCESSPGYPDGVELDGAAGLPGPACKWALPYPAPSIGVHVVGCVTCGKTVACTAAGRPDDPRTIRFACKRGLQ